jgi:hypothetical protein
MTAKLASTLTLTLLIAGCATAPPHAMPCPITDSASREYAIGKTEVAAAIESALSQSPFPIEHTDADEMQTRCVDVRHVPALADAYPTANKKELQLADSRCRKYVITVVDEGGRTAVRLRAKTIYRGDDVTAENWRLPTERASFDTLFNSIERALPAAAVHHPAAAAVAAETPATH